MLELLILQLLEQADFYDTGGQPKSTTISLTMVLKARHADELGNRIVGLLPRDLYKQFLGDVNRIQRHVSLVAP